MTGAELRATLERLGVSQEAGARLLGVDGRTMRRWIAEERDVAPPAVRLLWAMERDRSLVDVLRDYAKAPAEVA